jgi:hypothetical protein
MNRATGMKIMLAWFQKMEKALECNQKERKTLVGQVAKAQLIYEQKYNRHLEFPGQLVTMGVTQAYNELSAQQAKLINKQQKSLNKLPSRQTVGKQSKSVLNLAADAKKNMLAESKRNESELSKKSKKEEAQIKARMKSEN